MTQFSPYLIFINIFILFRCAMTINIRIKQKIWEYVSQVNGQKNKKVKLSLCLITQALYHEEQWGSGGIGTSCFFTLMLDGGVWPASHSCYFNLVERTLGTHWIRGGWASQTVWIPWIILHCWELNPGLLANTSLQYWRNYPKLHIHSPGWILIWKIVL
jgi:hypothetical protein